MDHWDRETVEQPFGKLSQVDGQSTPPGPQAAEFIKPRTAQQPHGTGYVAHAIMAQEQALAAAQGSMQRLDQEVSSRPAWGGGGLLSSLLGGQRRAWAPRSIAGRIPPRSPTNSPGVASAMSGMAPGRSEGRILADAAQPVHRMLSGLEYQAERLNNFLWETRLGIATRGRVESARSDSLECQSTAYSGVNRVLRHLSLQPSDVFVDIGCGKGRVVCCAAQYPCKRVVGVEYLAEVCREAQANAERMRGRKAPISIHTGPAEEFDYSEATVLYLCKPFGPTTFDAVLRKVQHETRGHSVRLAFVNPSPDHMAVLAAQGWEQTDYWDVVKGRGFSVSFCRRQEG